MNTPPSIKNQFADAPSNSNCKRAIFAALIIFVAALIPRLFSLDKFITADESRWVVRSMAFLTGLLTNDWQATLQTGHPGVTTMWGGSFGIVLNYLVYQSGEGTLLDFINTLSHNYEKIDPFILPWMRLSVVFVTSVGMVIFFWLLRRLNWQAAFIAALLLTFHPLYLAHSQLLHHDALVSVFIMLSALLWLTALTKKGWRFVILSGIMAGLAFLSKSTSYALLPFIALTLLLEIVVRQISWRKGALTGVIWSIFALIPVFLLWPALWVAPDAVWQTVFGWAVGSAEVDHISNTLMPNFNARFPDLGLAFYPVNWALKTTPLMVLGLLFVPISWRQASKEKHLRWWMGRLFLWIVIFSAMLTLGDKRDGRYLLPIYFALSILAAFGLKSLYGFLNRRLPLNIKFGKRRLNVYLSVFPILLLATSLGYLPYYLSYQNPLISGSKIAPQLVKVGWGEGMKEAAAWIEQQPQTTDALKVSTSLSQTFLPFFSGRIVPPRVYEPFAADYVLIYLRQIQNGEPFPEFWTYYQARSPAFQLKIAGIDYLWLHKEPPLATLNRTRFTDDLYLRAYTIDKPLAAPGKPFEVTLIWRDTSETEELVQIQLRDASEKVWAQSKPLPVIDPAAPSNVEGHYPLMLPPDMPRGDYALWVKLHKDSDWKKITMISAGYSEPIETIAVPVEANFGRQIALRGYNITSTSLLPGQPLTLTLHWQTLNPMIKSYTTFVHLLDPEGNTVAQADVLPGQGAWLTNTWKSNEWISDQIQLTLPVTLKAGQYRLLIGWYSVETGQRIPLINDISGQNAVVLDGLSAP
ncbi:MAG TPA: hypothetical protein G4N96_10095 [Chloroflexi bacterium]|nr:hypothetical protein [Chloroflexota bacterium]